MPMSLHIPEASLDLGLAGLAPDVPEVTFSPQASPSAFTCPRVGAEGSEESDGTMTGPLPRFSHSLPSPYLMPAKEQLFFQKNLFLPKWML